MADLQDMLLFVNYNGKMFDRNECVVLPRNNPFDDYDEQVNALYISPIITPQPCKQ